MSRYEEYRTRRERLLPKKKEPIKSISSLHELRNLANKDPEYADLLSRAAANLGQPGKSSIDSDVKWLNTVADETGSEEGVVDEVNFLLPDDRQSNDYSGLDGGDQAKKRKRNIHPASYGASEVFDTSGQPYGEGDSFEKEVERTRTSPERVRKKRTPPTEEQKAAWAEMPKISLSKEGSTKSIVESFKPKPTVTAVSSFTPASTPKSAKKEESKGGKPSRGWQRGKRGGEFRTSKSGKKVYKRKG
jgi:hypothetical protein